MRYDSLFEKLGYCFRNTDILDRALRHRSMGKQSNERLEFLGDAILNFVIADELFYRYPDMKEGELSRLRSNLVNGEVLAELALELQIGDEIKFGHSELRASQKSKSILADAMEAIIGAIYLDSGFVVVERHIINWFSSRLNSNAGVAKKDPKTSLQELLQMKRKPLPLYTIVETTGAAHAKTFKISCQVDGVDEATVGVGANKRVAEREAAEKMLSKIDKN